MVLCLVSLLFVSCSKDDNTDMPADNMPSYTGDFQSSAHSTSGSARINHDKTILSFTSFKTSSGPDLNIYLASDPANVEGDYIDLGNIKGVDGDYTYDLPAGTDYAKYRYVVVWCVTFHINFGYAMMVPQ